MNDVIDCKATGKCSLV